jgi:hypothetical protein
MFTLMALSHTTWHRGKAEPVSTSRLIREATLSPQDGALKEGVAEARHVQRDDVQRAGLLAHARPPIGETHRDASEPAGTVVAVQPLANVCGDSLGASM